MVNKCCLVFPNQLFKESKLLKTESHIFLVEEYLFFKQYKFHKQKISFHRATMKFYEDYLKNKNLRVSYINSYDDQSNILSLLAFLPMFLPCASEYSLSAAMPFVSSII